MATVDSVGEDKEVELKIIKDGIKIEYINDALIYDEKTSKSDVFVNQRRRWIAAQLSYFREYFFDGFKHLLFKGQVDYFDKVLQMVQPPRILLTGILFIITALLWILQVTNLTTLSDLFFFDYRYWLVLFIVTAFTLVISIPRKFYNFRTLKALLYIPVGFVLMMLSLMKIKGASKKFIHTTHSHKENVKSD